MRTALFADIIGVANIVESIRTLLLLMRLCYVYFVALLSAAIAIVCTPHIHTIIFDLFDSWFSLVFRLFGLKILFGLADKEGSGGCMRNMGVVDNSAWCHESVDPNWKISQVHTLCVVVIKHIGDCPCDLLSVILLSQNDSFIYDWI